MEPASRGEIKVDEILPPGAPASRTAGGKAPDEPASEVARILARWLDDRLRIPGTNFRIGLDPILAFFPGVGDFLASGSGLIILAESVRCGVTVPVLMRMAGNMLFNAMLGVVPVAGSVASAFFKSNARNYRLLQRWQAGQQKAVRKSTFRLFLALGFFALTMLALSIGLWAFYIWLFNHYFTPVVRGIFG